MKKNLIHQILFLLCIGGCALTIIIASSCEDKTSAQVHNPNEPITVTNFYPDSGGIATQVILNGENFGTDTYQIVISILLFIGCFIASNRYKVNPILLIVCSGVLGYFIY